VHRNGKVREGMGREGEGMGEKGRGGEQRSPTSLLQYVTTGCE